MQFALMDRRFLVAMQKFDRILDGQDVVSLLRIHLVENGRKRGGFSGARRAGDEYNSIPQINDFLQGSRKVQLLESWNCVRDDAHYDGAAPALLEDIYAETRDSREPVGEV